VSPRRILRALGLPARLLLVGLVRLYRLVASPLLGGQCRFHPSCSVYAEEAIRVHGAVKGSGLAIWRVLRCSPLGSGGPDPVPGRRAPVVYDSVMRGPS